jgi:hypothetical protein
MRVFKRPKRLRDAKGLATKLCNKLTRDFGPGWVPHTSQVVGGWLYGASRGNPGHTGVCVVPQIDTNEWKAGAVGVSDYGLTPARAVLKLKARLTDRRDRLNRAIRLCEVGSKRKG